MKIIAAAGGDTYHVEMTGDEIAKIMGYDGWWYFQHHTKTQGGPQIGTEIPVAFWHSKMKALVENCAKLRGHGQAMAAMAALLTGGWEVPVEDILAPLRKSKD